MLWIIFALLSAAFITIRSIVGKKVMQHEHATEYGAAQGFISLLLLIFFLPFIKLNFDWRIYLLLYIISVAFTVGNLYFLKSIRHAPISTAMPLMNISPVFLLIIAYFFLGESPSTLAVIGVLLLVTGTYILQLSTSNKGYLAPFKELVKSKYSMMMVMAMLIYSFTATMEKGIINIMHSLGVEGFLAPVSMFVIVRMMEGINFLILETSQHGFTEVLRDLDRDGRDIFIGTVASLGNILFFYLALGVPGALVALVLPVRRVSTLMSTLIGGVLFKEHRMGTKIIACVVMLAGIVLMVI